MSLETLIIVQEVGLGLSVLGLLISLWVLWRIR